MSVCIILFEKKQFHLFIHIYKNKTYKSAPDIYLLVNLWGLYFHSSFLHYKYMFANDMPPFQEGNKATKIVCMEKKILGINYRMWILHMTCAAGDVCHNSSDV